MIMAKGMSVLKIKRMGKKSICVILSGLFFSTNCLALEPYISETPLSKYASSKALSQGDRLATEAIGYIAKNDLEKASTLINQALQQKIDKSYYHLINGLIYHLMSRQGKAANYDLAAQGYEMAIRFDPSNWIARYYLGRLRVDEGKFDKAIKEFSEAMTIRPDDEMLLNALLFVAYRNGAPDVAAGAINALESSQTSTHSESFLRNSAMVMAALGEMDKSKEYIAKMRTSGSDPQLLAHLDRRINDWQRLYSNKSNENLLKTSETDTLMAPQAPPIQGYLGFGFPGMQPPLGPPPPDVNSKMVVVDVVMIGTEETISSSRGINLLNGLQVQFGGPAAAGGAATPAWQSKYDNSSAVTDTITRSITVPGITYSLNIFNVANQRNEVLARPTLVALTGQPSDFFSGVELNAVSGTGGQVTPPITIQKEIGVQLSVTPNELADGRLHLIVTAQRTFLKTPSADATFEQKIETTKNKVSANVVMRYGETLILGGLSEKESGMTRDGVPLLQDIPFLQYFFSRRTNSDYQKSVLILITPRRAEYVYQPENARQEYEKSLSDDERPIASLRARYADWFKPYPNWASVFHQLQQNSLYREFRTGDVDLETWADMRSVEDRLKVIKEFLYY
jgi:tetratricopeptide (TPR) repeat protein